MINSTQSISYLKGLANSIVLPSLKDLQNKVNILNQTVQNIFLEQEEVKLGDKIHLLEAGPRYMLLHEITVKSIRVQPMYHLLRANKPVDIFELTQKLTESLEVGHGCLWECELIGDSLEYTIFKAPDGGLYVGKSATPILRKNLGWKMYVTDSGARFKPPTDELNFTERKPISKKEFRNWLKYFKKSKESV